MYCLLESKTAIVLKVIKCCVPPFVPFTSELSSLSMVYERCLCVVRVFVTAMASYKRTPPSLHSCRPYSILRCFVCLSFVE